MYVYIYICIYVYIYVYTYIYVYIDTHTNPCAILPLPQITFSVSVGTSPCSYAREVREGWTMPDVLRRPTENPMCPTGMHLRVSSALKNWSWRQRKNLARGKGGRKAAAGPRIRHTNEKRARGCAGSVTSSPKISLSSLSPLLLPIHRHSSMCRRSLHMLLPPHPPQLSATS